MSKLNGTIRTYPVTPVIFPDILLKTNDEN